MAQEVLARIDEAPLSGRGDADQLLGIWRKAAGHVVAMLDQYVPGESDKRDRLIWEIMSGTGTQLLRIGEGLLQREKTDKLAGLLEQLKASEAEQKKSAHKQKKG